jgi:hypothetical protein
MWRFNEPARNLLVQLHRLNPSPGELALLDGIDAYLSTLRAAGALPPNSAYLFWSMVKMLALVVGKTPVTWLADRQGRVKPNMLAGYNVAVAHLAPLHRIKISDLTTGDVRTWYHGVEESAGAYTAARAKLHIYAQF